MAVAEEMQALVSDLRAAFSSRMQVERERRVEAAEDARERAAGVASRRSAVASTLGEVRRERMAEAAEVASTLGELCRERMAEAAEDARERAAGVASRRSEVAVTLDEVRRERMAEAAEDARERAAGVASRRSEVAVTLDEVRRERMAVRAELLEAGATWRDHSAAIASLRGRGSVSVPPPSKAARAGVPKPEATVEPEEATGRENEEATGRENPAEETQAVSAATVLAYLASHPDGVKLTELEARFNTPRIALARILSEMIADNRVRRDEKTRLYFAG